MDSTDHGFQAVVWLAAAVSRGRCRPSACRWLRGGCPSRGRSRKPRRRSQGGSTLGDWARSLEDALAVVNLAGKSINCRRRPPIAARCRFPRGIGSGPWRGGGPLPASAPVFVQTSAVGIYGDSGDAVCDESSPPGMFLGETCRQWEKAFEESPTPGVRRVLCGWGVLAAKAGPFPPWLASLAGWGGSARGACMSGGCRLPTRCGSFRVAIDRDDFRGVYVAAARSRRNAKFMRELRAAVHRRSPPVPAVALRLAGWLAGIDAELALAGQPVSPKAHGPRVFLRVWRTSPPLNDLVR